MTRTAPLIAAFLIVLAVPGEAALAQQPTPTVPACSTTWP